MQCMARMTASWQNWFAETWKGGGKDTFILDKELTNLSLPFH